MRYEIYAYNNCPILSLCCIGYSKDPVITRFTGQRNQYIIHYVLSGRGYFNGKTVGAGEGFIITPKTTEEYYPDKNDPWEFIWIISEDYKTAGFFEYCNADHAGIFKYNRTESIRSFADFLISNNGRIYTAFEMLELFLKYIKNEHCTSALNRTDNAEIYVNAALKYINTNISKDVHVSAVTKFLGVSQPYLYKIFKEKTGTSPKQYILNLKISRARQLLEETDLTVTQVASSVGFSDALSFSRLFHSKVGQSPQNYRKRFLSCQW